MSREWSERHIRDLVKSEWTKLGGGGASFSGIKDQIVEEFVEALKTLSFTFNTMDIKQNSFYEYHNIRIHANVVVDSVRLEKGVLDDRPDVPTYDIYFDYEGYVSLSDNRTGQITLNKRIGCVPKYEPINFPFESLMEKIIGTITYRWNSTSETIQSSYEFPSDIKLMFGYGNEEANKPDIICIGTGEELSLEVPMSMSMYMGQGLYVVRTMTDFSDSTATRLIGGSRHIQLAYSKYADAIYPNIDEVTIKA